MNLSLTPELERIVREQVESGRYGSSGEVVRDALLLLERRGRCARGGGGGGGAWRGRGGGGGGGAAGGGGGGKETKKGSGGAPPIPAGGVFARLRARIAAVAADPEA